MSAVQATTPRHRFEQLLAELTGAMSTSGAPVRHGWGTGDAAKDLSPERIVWLPAAGLGFAPARFQLDDREVISLLVAPFDVSIVAGSPAAVYQRVLDLAAWLDLLAGPKEGSPDTTPARAGYDLLADPEAKPQPRGGDTATNEWALTVRAVLKDFVVRRFFPASAPNTTPSIAVVTTDLDGTGEQAAVTWTGP